MPLELTPKHLKAARALLAWSQQDLAKAAKVATSTVADFERGQRTPVANNAQAIRSALEGAGIRFLPTGAVLGPALPGIASTSRHGTPIRWVNADDLSDWANQTDSQYSLPTLLAHLIRATLGSGVELRFPADAGVHRAGWDGVTCATESGSTYVPHGEAGWEFSCQKNNIPNKAMQDYQKRTDAPGRLVPANSTYVFVTLHHWPKKDEWANARKAQGQWRDVKAFDANDLVHWIEQAPAVGLWLAKRLGKRPAGTRELDEIWQEWSGATRLPLTEDLVLSDRDQAAAAVHRWLRDKPSVLALQASTTDEVAAFFHASLNMLPEDTASIYRTRCLVATTSDSARALKDAPAPLYLLLTDAEPGLAQSLVARGHYVLLAYDERPHTDGTVHQLARPSRAGIASALVAAGMEEPEAMAHARDCARNLAVLRRLMPTAPGGLPDWAQATPPRALLTALLAGGWDDNSQADQALIAKLADRPYDDCIAELGPYVGYFDKPLQQVGSTWRIAAPVDAWILLAPHLSKADIGRFEDAALTVFGTPDPRLNVSSNEPWQPVVPRIQQAHSGMLRQGIGQVLILLALHGDKARLVPQASQRADAIVRRLLREADPQRWFSLSRDFHLLAEASPEAFMDAIENSLNQGDPPIRALFVRYKHPVILFEYEYLSDLLRALNTLAWSPNLLSRVTLILARLAPIDIPPGRSGNRPMQSLREIHLLWNPQTDACLDQRIRAIDLIRKRQSNAAWRLMLDILPIENSNDLSWPSPKPKWREFTVERVETVTWGLVRRGANALSERVLKDVGDDAQRWSELINRISDLSPGPQVGLDALDLVEQEMKGQADRTLLWSELRSVLNRHRQFPDADRTMPAELLDRLDLIYERFAPLDPYERSAWLFDPGAALPKPSTSGWEADLGEVKSAREKVAHELFSDGGVTSILTLARQVGKAGHRVGNIGESIY